MRPTSACFQALMDAQPSHNDLVKKLMSMPLPSDLLRLVATVEAMRIPVPPPPPEFFQAPQNCAMVDVFRKVSSPTIMYPGKINLFGTQGAASHSSAAVTYSPFTIPRNSADQRIDPPTQASQELVESVKKRNACKDEHLRGHCRRKPCNFKHGVVKQQELEALRTYARQKPCKYGSKCRHATCYWGHVCPRGLKCDLARCNFRKTCMWLTFKSITTHISNEH